MKKITMTFLLLLTMAFLFAQEKKIEFVEYDLPNGMHVILHQNNSTPIVAVSVLYQVGSKNENPERTGFAHFFEHMMFEGSPNIKRGEYMNIVQSNGGILNANTSFDRTFYYEILPSNQLELALWLEAERLFHLRIDSIGTETQRKVVKEEIKQRTENQPYGSVLEKTFSNAFKVHPYRWTTLGSAEHINRATMKEFIDFHSMYYVPNNATLSIAGDLNIEETKKLIDKYFSEIPAGKIPIYRPNAHKIAERFKGKRVQDVTDLSAKDIVEPEQKAEVREVVYDNVQLPGVIMAYHIPEQGSSDYYALQMLGTLLSGGQSSRFNKEVKDKQQKAIFVGSFPLALEDPGLVLMFAIGNAGVSADDLEKSMQGELEKVKTTMISNDEFTKLKNQVENNFVNKRSTVAGIAEDLANSYAYFGDANLINTELSKYMAVKKEDILRVAKKYLNNENRVVLHYLPKSAKK